MKLKAMFVISFVVCACVTAVAGSTDGNFTDILNEIATICSKRRYTEKNFVCANRGNRTRDFEKCNCDSECTAYGDCCMDRQQARTSHKKCQYLTEDLGVYTVQRCHEGWDNHNVKLACEQRIYKLAHLQDVPVFSLSKKIFYANVFCAWCNNATDLKQWNTSLHCSNGNPKNITLMTADDFEYDTSSRTYVVNQEGKKFNCSLSITGINSKTFDDEYRARSCVPSIDDCPAGTSSGDYQQKCSSYMKIVYNKVSLVAYRNIHCAFCNGMSISDLTCYKTRVYEGGKIWFSMVLDFSSTLSDTYVGDGGNCNTGSFFDPVLQTCLNLHEETEDQTKASRETQDCVKVELEMKYVTMMKNRSAFVSHTNTLYPVSEYSELYGENNRVIGIVVCVQFEPTLKFNSVQHILTEVCLLISMICLGIHLLVYILLRKLRNLPGKVLMSLSLSLFLGHLFLTSGRHDDPGGVFCKLCAVSTHYFYVATFTWMNVMAYDIFNTFRRAVVLSATKKTFLFLRYSLYAWGLPLGIVVAAVIMDAYYSVYRFAPAYGKRVCWISKRPGLLVFFAIPVGILLCANIILFLITARNLSSAKKDAKIAGKKDHVRFLLYVKLAVIFGATWIFGFLAALTNLTFLWYPFIVLSGLQGLFIFLSFTLKRKVLAMLLERVSTRHDTMEGRHPGSSTVQSSLLPMTPTSPYPRSPSACEMNTFWKQDSGMQLKPPPPGVRKNSVL